MWERGGGVKIAWCHIWKVPRLLFACPPFTGTHFNYTFWTRSTPWNGVLIIIIVRSVRPFVRACVRAFVLKIKKINFSMTYYIFSESAGQNLVNERYCNIPSISNASFGHERSGSPSLNGLFHFIKDFHIFHTPGWRRTQTKNGSKYIFKNTYIQRKNPLQ